MCEDLTAPCRRKEWRSRGPPTAREPRETNRGTKHRTAGRDVVNPARKLRVFRDGVGVAIRASRVDRAPSIVVIGVVGDRRRIHGRAAQHVEPSASAAHSGTYCRSSCPRSAPGAARSLEGHRLLAERGEVDQIAGEDIVTAPVNMRRIQAILASYDIYRYRHI